MIPERSADCSRGGQGGRGGRVDRGGCLEFHFRALEERRDVSSSSRETANSYASVRRCGADARARDQRGRAMRVRSNCNPSIKGWIRIVAKLHSCLRCWTSQGWRSKTLFPPEVAAPWTEATSIKNRRNVPTPFNLFSIERALITQLERERERESSFISCERSNVETFSPSFLFSYIRNSTNYKFSLLRFRSKGQNLLRKASIGARVTPRKKRKATVRKVSNDDPIWFNAEDRKRDEIFSGRRDRRHCGFPFIAVLPS